MCYLNKELIKIGLVCNDKKEIIEYMGSILIKKGLVKDTFINAVLDREKLYPTGLFAKGVSVAIPHTDSTHVKESSVALAVLKKPVEFALMGGDGSQKIMEAESEDVVLKYLNDTLIK